MSTVPVVETCGLVKRFGEVEALAGIDLRVHEGEVLGYLGRNGAGKTTTLRILGGLARPTRGEARLFGADAWALSEPLRQRCGYVSDAPPPFGWMRVEQLLDFGASIHAGWDDAYERELVRRLDLPLRARISTLSLGQSRRLSLVMGLAHRPDLLLLDEPAGGLDPAGRREFVDVLLELLAADAKTVLLSSHILTDVERAASHIGILERGRLVYQGPIDALQESVRQVDLSFDEPVEALELPGALYLSRQGPRAWRAALQGVDERTLPALQARHPRARIETHSLSLEEIFLAYMETSHD